MSTQEEALRVGQEAADNVVRQHVLESEGIPVEIFDEAVRSAVSLALNKLRLDRDDLLKRLNKLKVDHDALVATGLERVFDQHAPPPVEDRTTTILKKLREDHYHPALVAEMSMTIITLQTPWWRRVLVSLMAKLDRWSEPKITVKNPIFPFIGEDCVEDGRRDITGFQDKA